MFRNFVLTLAATTLLATTAYAAEPLTKNEVEAIVKDTIEKNPELIVNSLKAYQSKQQAVTQESAKKAIAEKSKELYEDKDSPVVGSKKADVTVVEFFDYHCGYCKRSLPTVAKLLKEDSKVRVVFKEFPILSKDSEIASKAALAVFALKPEKYMDYHTVLMNASGKFDEDMLIAEAKKLGIDEEKMKEALKSSERDEELKKTRELAQALGIRGTPAFVIGKELAPGAISYEEMVELVKKARSAKK